MWTTSLLVRHLMPSPLAPSSRLGALDALRGVALLGIVIANVRQMFLPWEMANLPVTVSGPSQIVWWEWAVFDSLVDLKFLTIFSLLFGAGFELLQQRIADDARTFVGLYRRRLLVLGLLGLGHALLLYPADVLLPYAVGGSLLLACRRMRTTTLVSVGATLLGGAVLLAYQFDEWGRPDPVRTISAVAALAVTVRASLVRGWLASATAWVIVVSLAGIWIQSAASPVSPPSSDRQEFLAAIEMARQVADASETDWPEALRVRRLGGFGSLVGLNARLYADILLGFAVILLWRTLGLFMIGAALVRLGAFLPERAAAWRSVMSWGLGVGLSTSAIATSLKALRLLGEDAGHVVGLLHQVSALVLAAGIVGAIVVTHARTRAGGAWRPFEAAGRMPLTNYIGQSAVLAFVAESWGIGWYGRVDTVALSLVAGLTFTVLAALSMVWLTRFRMGPLEWVWRCATYGRVVPN